MEWNTNTLLIVFVAFTGLSVLLQALVLLGIFISLRKTANSVTQTTEDLKATLLPVVHSTRELVEKLTPQVLAISQGITEFTATVKKETNGVSLSAAEIMGRVSRQTERLDHMLTTGLNAVERAGAAVESTVSLPVRQVNGVMAGLKAMVETYLSVRPVRRQADPVRREPVPVPDPIEELKY